MKYSVLIIFSIIFSCYDKDADEFKKNCPYALDYNGHYLRIPITISPHRLQYKVGDTLRINTVFSDSIYDLGTKPQAEALELFDKVSKPQYASFKNKAYF